MTIVRRFQGSVAEQLFVLCRPEDGAAPTARQAETAYVAMQTALASEGATLGDVVSENLWFRGGESGAPGEIREVRQKVVGTSCSGVSNWIEQAPLTDGAALELAVTAVLPRDRSGSSVSEVSVRNSCSCPVCGEGLRARLSRCELATTLWSGNIYGNGNNALDEAREMFGAAERLLSAAGLGFSDVFRTWIYVRDIDRDYSALNQARREFFERTGIDTRPASTGVQGGPASDAHDFSMTLQAHRASGAPEVSVLTTPMLNEAWSYGADFSRGLQVIGPDSRALHISGTASIDESGRTAHVGDFDAQAERMLDNIDSLLVGNDANLGDVVSGVIYLPRPADAQRLREAAERRGFDGFPCALVEAPLCRPDLLCEAEALAVLPLPPGAEV